VRLCLIFLIILISSCIQQDANYLVGRWSFDVERTLAELKTRENVPSTLISCYEQKLCGSIDIEYSATTWQSIPLNGTSGSGKIGYVAKYKSKSEIVVNTKELDRNVEYTVVKLSDDLAYIELEVKKFKWKEYLKRTKSQ
jgi:hypothetical protein